MFKKGSCVKYTYKRYDDQPIPLDAIGEVVMYVSHPVTSKLIVDFKEKGLVIVPESAVRPCGSGFAK